MTPSATTSTPSGPSSRRVFGPTPTPTPISLLKAWWGDAARADNDWAYDYLPRLTGAHGTYQTVTGMLADEVEGYFLLGQNPAVGSANGRMQRLGMSHLKWLVVRDLNMIESATWWKDGPEIESGELRTEDIETEVFFLPAATHVEKAGSFTQTQRLLQWRHQAFAPPGRVPERAALLLRAGQADPGEAGRLDRRARPAAARPDLGLSHRRARRPRPRAVLAEINGHHLDRSRRRQRLSALHRAARRRVHRRRVLDLHRRVRRAASTRPPAGCPRWPEPEPVRVGLGVAGRPPDPVQPGVGRPGRQAVERAQALRLVGRGAGPVGR